MMLHFVDNLSIKTVIAIVSGSTLRQKTLDLKMLGPGLLFAATSVGASHLVQSTRAGALYGLSLLGLILLANAVKYPTFRFANDYLATVNTSVNLWKWIEVYGDAGFVKNKGVSGKFVYDSGVRLNLLTDYFELYLPVYSNNGWEVSQPNYGEKIRFIVTLSPKTLIGLFTRQWF